MVGPGGFDLRNLLTGHALAVLALFGGALLLLGVLTVSFKGSIVV